MDSFSDEDNPKQNSEEITTNGSIFMFTARQNAFTDCRDILRASRNPDNAPNTEFSFKSRKNLFNGNGSSLAAIRNLRIQ